VITVANYSDWNNQDALNSIMKQSSLGLARDWAQEWR